MKRNWRDEKIGQLRANLDKARAQRDQYDTAKGKLRWKLEKSLRRTEILRADHLALWKAHAASAYELETPSKELIHHVTFVKGRESLDPSLDFLHGGYLSMLEVRRLLHETEGFSPDQLSAVLDFGCGCARVTRFLKGLAGSHDPEIYGCDIDEAAIAWNQSALKNSGHYFVSPDSPPLPGDLPQFDLILAQSVFTHLPEDLQHRWLEELASRLAPGGFLLATFHGPSFHHFIPAESLADFQETGFLHLDLGRTTDLPDYYLTTFHTRDYIERIWSPRFKEIRIVDIGLNGQDAAILRA